MATSRWSSRCSLGEDAPAAETARGVLRRCLEGSVALLHPFMPFLTEEIWEKLTGKAGTLIVSAYPLGDGPWEDAASEAAVEALRAVVTRVRTFRTERGASPTEPVDLTIDPASPDRALVPVVEGLSGVLSHLARLSGVRFEKAGSGAFADVVAGLSLGLSLPRGAAADAGQRIEKSLAAADEEIAALRSKLENADFLGKAPAPVVEKVRARLFELEEKRAALVRS